MEKKERDNHRIDRLFARRQGNILSLYFTAGYPRRDSTEEVLRALIRHGADMIEVGVPFSDPVADGPVIQESSRRALDQGITLRIILEQVGRVGPASPVPLLLMSYLNPVLRYGMEDLCRDAAAAGIDGMIIPDLPAEEYLEHYRPLFRQHGLKNIFLVTPQTPPDRIRYLDKEGEGFLYVVSSRATTGARDSFSAEQTAYFRRLKEMGLQHPLLAGFGISNATTFAQACRWLDGAIVGSAYVKALAAAGNIDEITRRFLRSLRPDKMNGT